MFGTDDEIASRHSLPRVALRTRAGAADRYRQFRRRTRTHLSSAAKALSSSRYRVLSGHSRRGAAGLSAASCTEDLSTAHHRSSPWKPGALAVTVPFLTRYAQPDGTCARYSAFRTSIRCTTTVLPPIHYLFHADLGGTAFYRHRATGFESVDGSREREFVTALQSEFEGPDSPACSLHQWRHGIVRAHRITGRLRSIACSSTSETPCTRVPSRRNSCQTRTLQRGACRSTASSTLWHEVFRKALWRRYGRRLKRCMPRYRRQRRS